MLVTDGQLRSSLAVVRSLGRAGYRVHVCSPRTRSLAGASRYALSETRVAAPLTEPESYVEDVKRLAQRVGADFLLPTAEESLLALLPMQSELPRIPLAPLETFRTISDKQFITETAARFGIATPRQTVLETPDALRVSTTPPFPLVVKPARSISGNGAQRVKAAVLYADTPEELQSVVNEMPIAAFPLLLQQRIDGHGSGIFHLFWNGKSVAHFAHKRLREKPPTGGVSVCSESISADATVLEKSRALLESLSWTGPCMVEFKRESETGTLYLMEINGRFWGSLQLAIDAGVDFPRLLLECAQGIQPPEPVEYRIGAITRWWWGEVDHLFARLRGRPGGNGSRWDALVRFIFPERGARNEMLRADDPMPALRETIDWFQGR